MPVVINEFEIVEPPPPAPADAAPETPTAAAPAPDPQLWQRLAAEWAEQQLRLWSH